MFPCHQAMWLIRPGRVLRKNLRDFSLGHAYLLEALESPFMVGGRVGLGDLAVAVLVCSQTFSKAREFLMLPPPLLIKKANHWGWWCRLLRTDMDAEMEKFKDYMNAYTETPDAYEDDKKKGNESTIPTSARIAWTLMERMTEQEAWNCPMSRALAYYTTQAEYNGQQFFTENQERRLKVL